MRSARPGSPTSFRCPRWTNSAPIRTASPTCSVRCRSSWGVITGDESWHPLGAIAIEGENDGVVSVESAQVEGMKAFLVAPTDHTFIMRDPEVAKQVVHFLRTGEFMENR